MAKNDYLESQMEELDHGSQVPLVVALSMDSAGLLPRMMM